MSKIIILKKNPIHQIFTGMLIEQIIRKLTQKSPKKIGELWQSVSAKVQEKKIINIIEMVKDNKSIVADILENTNPEILDLKLDEIIEIQKDDPWKLDNLWYNIDEEIQKNHFYKLPELIDIAIQNANAMNFIWQHTNYYVQEENENALLKIIQRTKEDIDITASVWRSTSKKLQEQKCKDVINLFDNKKDDIMIIWKNTEPTAKKETINLFYEKITRQRFTKEIQDRLDSIYKRNNNILNKIDFNFLSMTEIFENLTEEQIIRITNYPETQKFFVENYNNPIMKKSINYLLKNDTNWIISLDKIIKNQSEHSEIINNLNNVNEVEISDEFIQQLLSTLSEKENYFEINNLEDVNNYMQKRNNICLQILNGKTTDIPETMKKFSQDELYKFALLEYKFGIDLNEAQRLINRYGVDVDNLPENTISDYVKVLKSIIECKDIKSIVDNAITNNQLESPWMGFPNARNAEAQVINLFEELYNEVLYRPEENEQDKNSEQETYIDDNGKEHKIDVYTIHNDFNMNIRKEGAFNGFGIAIKNIEDFKKYYEQPNIETTGNCESFIGNDNISLIKGERALTVEVGYSNIRKNSLTALGPIDLDTSNKKFSNHYEKSEFYTPQELINKTRRVNEMVKDRLVVNDDGNVTKYKPDYVVWIEEDTKEERQANDWKEKREQNEKWINTKRLATDLGIPIVIIDREYFAERETAKIEVMKKLITGDKMNEEEHNQFVEEYEKLSKPELVKQILIKFQNNKTGLRNKPNLNNKYFTEEQFNSLTDELSNSLETGVKTKKITTDEARLCFEEMYKIGKKEKIDNLYYTAENELESLKRKIDRNNNILEDKEIQKKQKLPNENFLQLYFEKGIDIKQVNEVKKNIRNELIYTSEKNKGQER